MRTLNSAPAIQNLVFLEAPGAVVSILQNQWLRMNANGRLLERLGIFNRDAMLTGVSDN